MEVDWINFLYVDVINDAGLEQFVYLQLTKIIYCILCFVLTDDTVKPGISVYDA